MKKTLNFLLLSLSLITLPVLSETFPPHKEIPNINVDGISKFNLGMSLNEFKSLFPDIKILLADQKPSSELYKIKRELIHQEEPSVLFTSVAKRFFIMGDFCPESIDYVHPKYEIGGENIKLNFKFYKGVLVQITSPTHNLNQMFINKYGQGLVKREEKEAVCLNRSTGNKFTEKTFKEYRYWKNDSILAKSFVELKLNDKCERSVNTSFKLEHEQNAKPAMECKDKYNLLKKQSVEKEIEASTNAL